MNLASKTGTWNESVSDTAIKLAGLSDVQRQVAIEMAGLNEAESEAVREMIKGTLAIQQQTISQVAARAGIESSTLAKAANAKETSKMTVANLQAALASDALSEAEKDSLRNLINYITTTNLATSSTEGFKASVMSLGTAISVIFKTNPFGVILTIVSALIPLATKLYGKFHKTSEEIIESGKEARETYLQAQEAFAANTKTVNELEDEFNALSKGVDENGKNVSLTQEEYSRYLEIVDNLVQISPQIVQGYDNEGKAILNYKDAIKETRDELEKLNQAEIDSYLGQTNAEKVFNEANEKRRLAKNGLFNTGRDIYNYLYDIDGALSFKREKQNTALDIFGKYGVQTLAQGGAFESDSLPNLYKNYKAILSDLRESEKFTKDELTDLETKFRDMADDVQDISSADTGIQSWTQTWVEQSDWFKEIPSDTIGNFNAGLAEAVQGSKNFADAQSKAKTYADSFLKIYSQDRTKKILNMADGLKEGTVSLEEYNAAVADFKDDGDIGEAESSMISYFENLSNAAKDSADAQTAAADEAQQAIDKNIETVKEIDTITRMLSAAYAEFEKDGSVSAETYREVTSAVKDSADIFTTTNGVYEINGAELKKLTDKLAEEKGAVLAANGANEKQIASLKRLTGIYSEAEEEASRTNDDIMSSVKSLIGIMDDMNEGTEYSTVEIIDLLEQYPSLASAIEKTTTGYKIETEAVKNLIRQEAELYSINSKLASQNFKPAQLSAQGSSNIDKVFEGFKNLRGKDIESLEEYVYAYKKAYGQIIDFDKTYDGYKEYIQRLIDERKEISMMSSLIGELGTENQVNGYTPDKSSESASESAEATETAFEKAYKYHQHLLAMDQETTEQYLAWLTGAYQQAYAAGEMELDDFYKYQEEVYEKTKEVFDASLADMEHQIDQLSHQEDTSAQIVEIYKQMQEKVHAQANKYRSMGLAENNDLIEALQDQWWEYEDAIRKIREDDFNDYLNDSKFAIDVLKTNNADAQEIIDSWKSILSSINDEIAYYTSVGYKETSDVVQSLMKEAESAKEAIIEAIDEVVDKANELVDGVRGVYDTLTSAAKEYASTGYLSVDSLQSILELAPKYLDFLYDENGQLVLNEESIQKVIAAKTEEMAVETALAYAKKVLNAAEQGDIEALKQLADVTAEGSKSTWDMVYATLGLAKATGVAKGMEESYFDDAISYVTKMQSLTQTAVNTISDYYKTLDDNYISQADALQKILELTEDMIKQENEDQVEALEKEKELYNDIVDRKKESLKLSQDQEKHDRNNADKLKEIAKLQSRIEQLSLDDSREAQAQKRQLEEELYEKQRELADSQSDYSIETQTDALDKEYEAYEQEKDKEINALKETLNSAEKLYQAAIARINNGWDALYEDLMDWNSEYGLKLARTHRNVCDINRTNCWNTLRAYLPQRSFEIMASVTV